MHFLGQKRSKKHQNFESGFWPKKAFLIGNKNILPTPRPYKVHFLKKKLTKSFKMDLIRSWQHFSDFTLNMTLQDNFLGILVYPYPEHWYTCAQSFISCLLHKQDAGLCLCSFSWMVIQWFLVIFLVYQELASHIKVKLTIVPWEITWKYVIGS